MLEMVPGFHTQKIVEEIFRLSENTSKSAPSSDNTRFDWLEKYINSDAGKYGMFAQILCSFIRHAGIYRVMGICPDNFLADTII